MPIPNFEAEYLHPSTVLDISKCITKHAHLEKSKLKTGVVVISWFAVEQYCFLALL
jgi:hypothetical protein